MKRNKNKGNTNDVMNTATATRARMNMHICLYDTSHADNNNNNNKNLGTKNVVQLLLGCRSYNTTKIPRVFKKGIFLKVLCFSFLWCSLIVGSLKLKIKKDSG